MRIQVLGGDGGGLLSDVTVYLVGSPGTNQAALLSQLFPGKVELGPDGSVNLPIRPGTSFGPKIVDAVEIESDTLTVSLIAVVVIVVLALFYLLK